MSLYIFEGRNIYFTYVFIYSTLHVNYSLYIINRNILFNAIVTCMNKYIIYIMISNIRVPVTTWQYILHSLCNNHNFNVKLVY